MQPVSQVPVLVQMPAAGPVVQGDRAARRFGIFFFSALAVMTIGAGVGIGVGNLAHYKYFSPNNATNLTSEELYNLTAFAAPVLTDRLVMLSFDQTMQRRDADPLWMSHEPSMVDDEDGGH